MGENDHLFVEKHKKKNDRARIIEFLELKITKERELIEMARDRMWTSAMNPNVKMDDLASERLNGYAHKYAYALLAGILYCIEEDMSA